MRRNTQDKEAPGPPQQEILTSEQIGQKRHLTPEGFLLCEAVPVARTGWMMYGPGQSPIKVGDHGYAMVTRDEATLFDRKTIASFLGKPVTNEHPPLGVDPENWSHVCCGTVLNVRRGEGDDSDVLLADLLITKADAIRAVQQGKREVSAGYDADYETTGPGEGRQLNIIGNHIALVDRGRCGPRCSIGDSLPDSLKGIDMPSPTQRPRKRAVVSDAVRAAINAAVADVLADPVLMNGNESGDSPNETDASHVHVHLHTAPGSPTDAPNARERANGITPGDLDETDDDAEGGEAGTPTEKTDGDPYEPRIAALEKGHKEIHAKLDTLLGKKGSSPGAGDKPGGEQAREDDDAFAMDEDGDDIPGENDQTEDSTLPAGQTPANPEDTDGQMGQRTGDSAALLTAYQSLLADAEILAPGFTVPTFDSKAGRKVTIDTMCKLRRKALDSFGATETGKTTLGTLVGRPTFDLAKMSCKQTAVLFRAAAGVKRLGNNQSATSDAGRVPQQQTKPRGVPTIAELNALHRTHYKH